MACLGEVVPASRGKGGAGYRRLTVVELISQQAQLDYIGLGIEGVFFQARLLEVLDADPTVHKGLTDRITEDFNPTMLLKVF